MSKAPQKTKAETLEAIKGSGAIMSTIAKRLGYSWNGANLLCQRWEETKRALQDETETILDLAESTLVRSIQEGDVQSAKWILATKGKFRGFTERHEIAGPEGGPVEIVYVNDFEGV